MTKRQQGNSKAVLQYLMKNKNVEVHTEDIMAATDLWDSQVHSALNNLKRTTDIENPRRGWYIYRGPLNGKAAISVRSKAEVVAMTHDGALLISVEGQLYLARQLDL